jgi:phosphoribosylamine--glycine ligase
MGAYSPAPVVTPEVHARIMREVIDPTVAGMAADGMPYGGFLYAGIMIDAEGAPKVLEFNCRLGDPETQPILLRLKSDLIALFLHAIDGSLDRAEAEWDRRPALGVVLAAAGYPDEPRKVTVNAHPQVGRSLFTIRGRFGRWQVLTGKLKKMALGVELNQLFKNNRKQTAVIGGPFFWSL